MPIHSNDDQMHVFTAELSDIPLELVGFSCSYTDGSGQQARTKSRKFSVYFP